MVDDDITSLVIQLVLQDDGLCVLVHTLYAKFQKMSMFSKN